MRKRYKEIMDNYIVCYYALVAFGVLVLGLVWVFYLLALVLINILALFSALFEDLDPDGEGDWRFGEEKGVIADSIADRF